MPGNSLRSGLASVPRTSSVRVSCDDARVERGDLSLEDLARKRIDGELDDLIRLELADVLLGHGKVDPDGIERLQRHQRQPGRYVLAELDLANAEPAGERRQDRLLSDQRLDAVDGGGGGVALGERGIDVGLRGNRLAHEVGLPLEGDVRLAQRRFGAREIGELHVDVELHELVALGNILAALEAQRRDDAGDLRGDVDALRRNERSDRRQPLDPLLAARRFRRDGRGRRHLARQEPLDHLRLEDELEVGEPAEEDGQDDAGNEESLDHRDIPTRDGARAARN